MSINWMDMETYAFVVLAVPRPPKLTAAAAEFRAQLARVGGEHGHLATGAALWSAPAQGRLTVFEQRR